jgi:hypothetical protein
MSDLKLSKPSALPAGLLHGTAIAVALCVVLACPAAHAQSLPEGIDPALVQSTRGIASDLLNQLGAKLKAAMATDGPIAAVSVCKEVAPAIAKDLSAKNHAQVTRVGTRVRNPQMGVPNAWQKVALADFEQRIANGEKPAEIEHWSVAEGSDGKRELRYAKAIALQPQCLSCHGNKDDIPAPLAEKIRLEYPNDQAVGYSVGKLRGAVVVSRVLPAQ